MFVFFPSTRISDPPREESRESNQTAIQAVQSLFEGVIFDPQSCITNFVVSFALKNLKVPLIPTSTKSVLQRSSPKSKTLGTL